MKILWVSNAPWANTGYGQQTAMVAKRLQEAGHDVAFLAFFGLEGALGTWEGMTVYPTDHTRLGKHFLPDYAKHHAKGDPVEDVLVLTLMDIWTMTDVRWGGVARVDNLNMASWVPIDHEPCPPKVMQAIEYTKTRPIAMSKFGQKQLEDVGMRADYVPHAVDTEIFQDFSEGKEIIKRGLGIPENKFVVGMVANNQGNGPPRKAFPQAFQAFAEFRRRHDDVFLYLHTDVHGLNDGINLVALADIVGIPGDSIAVVDQFKYHIGVVSQPIMARIYSCFDTLLMPSYGEGFGIPIIEAQACGTPVIASDWTAMPELVSAGWKVQGDAWYDAAHGSFYMCPSVMEIIDALELAYENRDNQELRKQAVEGMAPYDANYVFENHWLPVMRGIETPIVLPNREERRRAAKKGGKK